MGGLLKAGAWVPAVLAFLGGALLLIPSQASAQFNIEGLIRGMGGYHGGGYRYHSSRHSSRHEASHHSRHEKDDDGDSADKGKESDKGKEKDATKDEAASANAGSHAQPSAGPSHDAGGAAPTEVPQKPTSNNKPNDDQPAFSPAR
jgi:hypothetical protein